MGTPPPTQLRPKSSQIAGALILVYIVWGSWFMFTAVAVRTIPPMFGVAGRNLLAVVMLVSILAARGRFGLFRELTRAQLLGCLLCGTLFEISAVLWTTAEKTVPSALTAFICAGTPMTILLLRKGLREKVPLTQFIACAVGLAGMAILILPGNTAADATALALILIVIGVLTFAVGTLTGAKIDLPENPFVSSALFLLLPIIWLVPGGVIAGEGEEFSLGGISLESWAGSLAIITLGNIALVAYVWLMRNAGASTASTSTFVTPVVALVMGVVVLGESFSPIGLIGAAVVLGAVIYIVRTENRTGAQQPTVEGSVAIPATVVAPSLEQP